MACEYDRDCPGAEICFSNLSWVEEAFCDCSTFFGGEGPDCSELNFQSYTLITIAAFVVSFCLAAILLTCLFDVRVAFIRYGLFKYDDTVSILILAFYDPF